VVHKAKELRSKPRRRGETTRPLLLLKIAEAVLSSLSVLSTYFPHPPSLLLSCLFQAPTGFMCFT